MQTARTLPVLALLSSVAVASCGTNGETAPAAATVTETATVEVTATATVTATVTATETVTAEEEPSDEELAASLLEASWGQLGEDGQFDVCLEYYWDEQAAVNAIHREVQDSGVTKRMLEEFLYEEC